MDENTRNTLIEKRKYRKDISGDTLTLYISNSPVAAKWLAKRIGNPDKSLLELCCGVGVTLEYLGPVFKKAIGVDIDKEILSACNENLERAKLFDRVELITGDVRDVNLLQSLKADTVIYDIPYWYPHKYSKYSNKEKPRENPDLIELVSSIRKYISEDIVIFSPKENGYEYFKNILGECECIEIFIDGKHDRNYILFGSLVKEAGSNSIHI